MDFSSETMEARRQWNSIYKQQNSPSNENKIKTFSYKQNYGIYHKQTCVPEVLKKVPLKVSDSRW